MEKMYIPVATRLLRNEIKTYRLLPGLTRRQRREAMDELQKQFPNNSIVREAGLHELVTGGERSRKTTSSIATL
jgi:hypothetical protein